jgi:apolipoprotein N-acyltransferase
MPSLALSWAASLASLGALALLIHLWQRPEQWAPRLASGLLILLALVGLHWIYISLHDYGHMPMPLAALGTLALAVYVSAYGIAAGWLHRRFQLSPWALAGLITLLEWVRGELFTGFPWLSWGYQQIDSPLAGFAPIFGVFGVTFITALCAAWLTKVTLARVIGIVAIHIAGLGLFLVQYTTPAGPSIRVALIQSAVPQHMKFDPEHVARLEEAQLQLIQQAMRHRVNLVALPETAFIKDWNQLDPSLRSYLRGLVHGTETALITGVPLKDEEGWFNSAIAILPQASPYSLEYDARYNKSHLVPFGEFVPFGFRWFVDQMQMPLGDFARGLPIQAPMEIAGQRIGVNICFEDLFGDEIARPLASRIAPDRHPTILLNLSNLAWFGHTIALSQHLSIARMRSLETGRPTIRATNTGMTAIVDHKGDVRAALQPMAPGILVGTVQGMGGATPFTRFGSLPILLIAAICLLLGLRSSPWRTARMQG